MTDSIVTANAWNDLVDRAADSMLIDGDKVANFLDALFCYYDVDNIDHWEEAMQEIVKFLKSGGTYETTHFPDN